MLLYSVGQEFTHGTHECTRIMKTIALRQALDADRFDAAIGGSTSETKKSESYL